MIHTHRESLVYSLVLGNMVTVANSHIGDTEVRPGHGAHKNDPTQGPWERESRRTIPGLPPIPIGLPGLPCEARYVEFTGRRGERRQHLPAQWSPWTGKPFLPQEVAKETNCFQTIHHLLVLCKKTATGFGIIKAISPPRGFLWIQMSPGSLGILYEKLQGEITTGQIGSQKRPSPLRGVTSKEPVMDLHGEGVWWLRWEKQLGLRIWLFITVLGSWLRPDMLLRIIEHTWTYDFKSVNLFSLIQTHNPWSFKSQLSSFVHHILFIPGLFCRIWKVECWEHACLVWRYIWRADGLWVIVFVFVLFEDFDSSVVFLVAFPQKHPILKCFL